MSLSDTAMELGEIKVITLIFWYARFSHRLIKISLGGTATEPDLTHGPTPAQYGHITSNMMGVMRVSHPGKRFPNHTSPPEWYQVSGPLWPDLITTSNKRLCTVCLSQKPGNRL